MSSMIGPRRLYRLLIDLVQDHVHWRVRCNQAPLAARLGCTLRTLQRWTAQLRAAGWVETQQSIDSRGYLSTNIYSILIPPVDDDLGGPGELNKEPGHPDSPAHAPLSVEASLRSEAAPQICPISEVRTGEPVVSGMAQLSLFDDLPLDGRLTSDKTSARESGDAASVKRSTPANRVMAYWLEGRTTRPSRGAVAGMAGAVATCLKSGLTEAEVRAALDDLMRQDLDWSHRRLLAYVTLAGPSKAKPRDYDSQPLYKQHPRRTSMRPERAHSLDPRRTGSTGRDAVRSFARRMAASLRSSIDSSPAGTISATTPLPDHRHAAQEALYVQRCREEGKTPAVSSKGVTSALVARLRASAAVAQ